MFRSYWRYILAAFGVLVAIGLLGYLMLGAPRLPEYQKSEGQSATYRAGGPECDPARLRTLPDGDAPDERKRCEEAAEEHRLKSDDLVQQTRAADAAGVIVGLTYRQTVLLFVGLLLGLLTLGAALYAAWYAKRAAEAAEKGLTNARHTARPYFASELESFVKEGEEPGKYRARVLIRNTGNTPAHGLVIIGQKEFRYNNGGIVRLPISRWYNGTTGPNTPVDLGCEIVLAPDEERAFREDKGIVSLDLIARYTNNFGERWVYTHDLFANETALKGGDLYTSDCSQNIEPDDDDEDERRHQELLALTGGTAPG